MEKIKVQKLENGQFEVTHNNLKQSKMKRYSQQKQVVAIYANSYSVLFTDKDPLKVKKFASENRAKLKKDGAIKVITNIGLYES